MKQGETNDPAPRVSVILPCRNEADSIEACLRSIASQDLPPGGCEVIVVDGMSDDGTREILARYPSLRVPRRDDSPRASADAESVRATEIPLRVLDNPARIVSPGLNLAIRSARGEIIVRMDCHTEYAPDYIRRCVEALTKTGADNVGGPAGTKATTYMQRAIAAAYHSPFAVGGARFHNLEYEGYVDTVTYGCWRRDSFERFGYFDEELVRNQDDEHNLRIVRGGGRIWQSPAIRSWYRPRGTLAGLFRQYSQYGYWKVRVIQKHAIPASWRHLVPGTFVLALIVTTLGSLFSPVLALLALMLAGTYAACVGVSSLLTAGKSEMRLLPVLPLVFACYHFGYGWGFLWGFIHLVLLRRSPVGAFTQLTRGAGAVSAPTEGAATGPSPR